MGFRSTFASKPFPTSTSTNTVAARYRRGLQTRPFALFGLPFIVAMLAGSFFLTPATAVRYERYDRKTHTLDRHEAMNVRTEGKMRKQEGKRDLREEYFRLAGRRESIDDWEPKRVERLPGEPDGTV